MTDWHAKLKDIKGFKLDVTVDDFQVEDDCLIFRYDGNKDYRIVRFNILQEVEVNDDGIVTKLTLTDGTSF